MEGAGCHRYWRVGYEIVIHFFPFNDFDQRFSNDYFKAIRIHTFGGREVSVDAYGYDVGS